VQEVEDVVAVRAEEVLDRPRHRARRVVGVVHRREDKARRGVGGRRGRARRRRRRRVVGGGGGGRVRGVDLRRRRRARGLERRFGHRGERRGARVGGSVVAFEALLASSIETDEHKKIIGQLKDDTIKC